jgi:hypothetical protein
MAVKDYAVLLPQTSDKQTVLQSVYGHNTERAAAEAQHHHRQCHARAISLAKHAHKRVLERRQTRRRSIRLGCSRLL